MNRTNRTFKKRASFLAALRRGASIADAARAAGVGRRTVYDWRAGDATFAAQWNDAVETGTDAIEDALLEKAMRMDDAASVTAAIFLLKARRPEKYRERHQVRQEGGIFVTHDDISRARKRLAKMFGMDESEI